MENFLFKAFDIRKSRNIGLAGRFMLFSMFCGT